MRETPVLFEPAIEAREGRASRLGVVTKTFLHPDPESGKKEGPVNPLAVQLLEPRLPIAVGGTYGLQTPEEFSHALALGVSAPKELVQGAGLGDGIERRIGNEPVDLAPHQQALTAIDLRPLHAAASHPGIDMANERVLGLVIMVVGVESRISKFAHASLPPRQGPIYSCTGWGFSG